MFWFSGLALKCYNCDSQYNSDCSDDGYNKQMKECEELGTAEKFLNVEAVCLKEVTNGEKGKRTLRKCTRKGGSFHTCSVVFGQSSEHCSLCESNLCNGSENLLINTWMIVLPVVGVFIKILS